MHYVPPKRRFSQEPHGVTSQKTPFFGKYSFVNRTTQLWNQLPEDALVVLSCKPSSFRKKVREVINKAK
jgi:hypothetical protein